jgi:superfamily II DNA/RNA helicase
VQAIILAPSRELVTQIALVGEALFRDTDYRILPIIGGANVRGQINRLRDDKPQIIVATPGRLAELIFGLERLRLGMVKAVVLDEVDNLLREPYTGELQTILEATPVFRKRSASGTPETEEASQSEDITGEEQVNSGVHTKRRMVCFASATGNDPKVTEFINGLYPATSSDEGTAQRKLWSKVSAGNNAALPFGITHGLISCPRIKALDMLKKLIRSKPEVNSSLIFVNDPHRVEIVCEKLLEMGIIAAPLHGDSSKDDRKEILTRLRDGRLPLVVTTELAARGA